MSDGPAVGDLVAAVADALHGDRTSLKQIITDAKERTRERLVDALTPRAVDSKSGALPPAPALRRVPQPGPAREIEIRLRDGRRLRAATAPAAARRQDLAAVARATAVNNRRAFAALRQYRGALERLRRSQDTLGKRVTALEQQGDLELVSLLRGLQALDRQVRDVGVRAQAVAAGGPATPSGPGTADAPPTRLSSPPPQAQRQQQLRQIEEKKLLAVRAQIQSIASVVNTVQAAAFGERGSLFSTNNLLLAGNQLFWSLLDPVLESISVVNATSATAIAALAPLGTLLTGQVLLGNRQHVRFISGATTVLTTGDVVRESLRGRVVEGAWPAFRDRTDVPVTATVTDPPGFSTADVFIRVRQGSVEIGIIQTAGVIALARFVQSVRVAWTVDTGLGDA